MAEKWKERPAVRFPWEGVALGGRLFCFHIFLEVYFMHFSELTQEEGNSLAA